MLAALERLVSIESPSSDVEAVAACAREVAELGARLLEREPETLLVDGRPHLRWSCHAPRVGVIGHLDTVWPLGTVARWPFSVANGIATGPGAFDMKAGIVQCFYALAALDDRDGIELLLTSDEELGSPTSRNLVEETARRVSAALIIEPSADAALKTARKGVSLYALEIEGRAAHAGLEPERGANALIELAHQVLAVERLARPDVGTTVTPTVAAAGTVANVIPASARLTVDVRAATSDEQLRVDGAMHALQPTMEGTRVTVTGAPNRPPLPSSASADLFRRASAIAEQMGLGPLRGAEVGGGSDGNFTAGVGTPTLDGLGPVGAGAHAEGEHVVVAAMAERAALLAALVDELRGAWGAE